jgi:hypothetical protein
MPRADNVFPFLSLFGARQRTFRQEEFSKRWVTYSRRLHGISGATEQRILCLLLHEPGRPVTE